MSIKTIENMVEWIENNITRDVTLSEMSTYVGYSPYYCSAKFHEIVGISFKQYISKRRLSLAAAEIKTTKLRFLDIALKYGFSSQEAFTRAFVNAYGCTPNQYRKQQSTIKLFIRPNMFQTFKENTSMSLKDN